MIKYFVKTNNCEAEFRTQKEADAYKSSNGGYLGVKEEFETNPGQDDNVNEVYIIEGYGSVDAISMIQDKVNSGEVDNYLTAYADALIRIDEFLGDN